MVLILLCIGALSYLNIRRQAVQQLVRGYQDKAEEKLNNIDSSISEIERMLHYLSRNPVMQKVLLDRYDTFLEANNEVAKHVEGHFWYLTTSVNSGIRQIEVISFRDIPSVGGFIYGKEKLKEHDWYEKLIEKKKRILYTEDSKVYLVYPVYSAQGFDMIGAIWVRLDNDHLWQSHKSREGVLGCRFGLDRQDVEQQGELDEGIPVEAKSSETGFYITYAIAGPALLEGGLVMFILVVLGGFAIIFLFLHYTRKINRDYEKNLEEKRKQEYLQAMVLKAQISPHFLYNIMSMINWKAKYSGQDDISQISLELSNFYRTALNRGQEEITVKDELLNIESYLKLKLQLVEIPFTYDIEVESGCDELLMINFILQPIVENAILHGIGNREEGGHIQICVCRQADSLIFTVSDNGQEPVSQEDFFRNTSGYGVRNVHKRIRLKYGEEYGVFMKNTKDGTEVTLKLGILTKNIVSIQEK